MVWFTRHLRKEVIIIFVNFSNHPSKRWSDEQLTAARTFGEIRDIKFPNVPPSASSEEVKEMAKDAVEDIMSNGRPEAVMAMGETSMVFHTIAMLKNLGIKCLVACSERIVELDGDKKIVKFQFQQFREV